MSINQILPFFSTVIMLGFTVYVLQRYWVRRAPHFLFWGIGLAMFGAGSFAEVECGFDAAAAQREVVRCFQCGLFPKR